jgi:zinc D-Ala-D-Ala carboxypeptidase
MNVSRSFTLKEMVSSTTASRLGIDNSPSLEAVNCLIALAGAVLQPLRDHMGEPIRISSGYRNPVLNKRIGGSKSSQHTLGQAADLVCPGRNSEMFHYIKDNLPFDQLIWEFGNDGEPDWVHVSYRSSDNRGEALVATKKGKKTVYLPFKQ